MNPIKPPISLGNSGEQVANLQSALIALSDAGRGVFKTFLPPDGPTEDPKGPGSLYFSRNGTASESFISKTPGPSDCGVEGR